jgi:polyisoprenoid-binding protein YceI
MRSTRPVELLALAAALAGVPRAGHAEAPRFRVDPDASRVLIHVGKSGVFGFAGHEHEVTAPIQHGSLSADPDHLGAASVEISVDAAALRVTGAGEPAKDVPAVQKTMLGPECLDVARFPSIRFVSTGVTGLGRQPDGHRIAVRGSLTLHGVTRAITLPARIDFKADTIEASGTVTIRQTDFGMKPISKGGVVNVKDELDLDWRLVARHPASAGDTTSRSGAGPGR